MKFITVPAGRFAAEEDAAAAKRREIAERLKRGESVNVTLLVRLLSLMTPRHSSIER